MAIDGARIIHAVMEGSRIRESKGIIPLFGVYLSLFSVRYYNRLNFNFEKKMGPSREAEADCLLIKAAQECGYATFQGIRNSWEWNEIVKPMIDRKKRTILLGFCSSRRGVWLGRSKGSMSCSRMGNSPSGSATPMKPRVICKITGTAATSGKCYHAARG
jgi:hypothetical protein